MQKLRKKNKQQKTKQTLGGGGGGGGGGWNSTKERTLQQLCACQLGLPPVTKWLHAARCHCVRRGKNWLPEARPKKKIQTAAKCSRRLAGGGDSLVQILKAAVLRNDSRGIPAVTYRKTDVNYPWLQGGRIEVYSPLFYLK